MLFVIDQMMIYYLYLSDERSIDEGFGLWLALAFFGFGFWLFGLWGTGWLGRAAGAGTVARAGGGRPEGKAKGAREKWRERS
jgi:hypothetical protein